MLLLFGIVLLVKSFYIILELWIHIRTLDHFNYWPESYTTFPQTYIVNFTYLGGANSSAPIFAYLGIETLIDDDLNVIGFRMDNAITFNAVLVYIEVKV